MNKLMTTGTLGLASLVTTGLIAWPAPLSAGPERRAADRPLPHELAEALEPVLDRLPAARLGGALKAS